MEKFWLSCIWTLELCCNVLSPSPSPTNLKIKKNTSRSCKSLYFSFVNFTNIKITNEKYFYILIEINFCVILPPSSHPLAIRMRIETLSFIAKVCHFLERNFSVIIKDGDDWRRSEWYLHNFKRKCSFYLLLFLYLSYKYIFFYI